jgi:protein SCO1/2
VTGTRRARGVVAAALLLAMGRVAAAGAPSLYEAPLAFRTDRGEAVTLDHWKGETVVLTMVFTSCQATCPITMAKLAAIQERFDRDHVAARFLVASFDPARDTPEHLARYRVDTNQTKPNWTFLVGSEEDTRMLAMLLGIKYARNPLSGDIMHDNKIVLLNGDGVVTKELVGLDAPIEDFR